MSQSLMSPHRVIATRIKELRKKRGWSAARLASEMSEVGIPWDRSIVANLELGRRATVSVEEWLALSYVFNVAPIHLVVPTVRPSAVRVVPQPWPLPAGLQNELVDIDNARQWICGERPLRETDGRLYFSEVDERTYRERFGRGSAIETSDGTGADGES